MTRALYRGLLWLHPVSFEEQFGEELLWIFDLKRESEMGLGLVFDCFISLCRQWLFRSGFWTFGVGLLVNVLFFYRLIFYSLTIDIWKFAGDVLANVIPLHRLIMHCSGLAN